MHIQEASKWTVDAFKSFKEQSKSITNNEKDLSSQLRSLPKFQQLKAKFSVNITLINECMEIFKSGVERIASVEQEITTGTDGNLKKITEVKDLIPLLQLPSVSKENRLRILMMYYASNPKVLEAQQRKSFEATVRVTDYEERALKNWVMMKNMSMRQAHQYPAETLIDSYELWRFVPTVYNVIEGAIKGTLSSKDYPFFKPSEENSNSLLPPSSSSSSTSSTSSSSSTISSSSSSSSSSAAARRLAAERKKGQRARVTIFIVGGCTYSEIRAAHVLSEKENYPDVVIGSTHIYNPKKFTRQVAGLSSPQGVNDPAFATSYIGKDAIEKQRDDD